MSKTWDIAKFKIEYHDGLVGEDKYESKIDLAVAIKDAIKEL